MRILWFGVNAGLVPAFTLESHLANGLALSGDQVLRVACDGIFSDYCPVMQAQQFGPGAPKSQKKTACRKCKTISQAASSASAYQTTSLENYLLPEDHAAVAELIDQVTHENWHELEVADIPVGRYATYLVMLRYKVSDVTASKEAWDEYLIDLRNALLTLRVVPRIVDEFRPTHAMVYNPLYPTNRMFVETAKHLGIQVVSITVGNYIPNRYRCLAIYPHISASQTARDSRSVIEALHQPCSREEISGVVNQIRALTEARDPWVYSSVSGEISTDAVKELLNLRPAAPAVLALVASPDETRSSALVDAEYERSSSHQVSDVPEFVQATVDLAKRNPDLDVILRLHPRLAPNKRERTTSPDLALIMDLLTDTPPNLHINKPSDRIGLYDVMRVTSVGLNQSSSAGLELLTMGIPVVHYDPIRLNAYPPELGLSVEPRDPESLDRVVRLALTHGFDSSFSVRAFRWHAVTLLRCLVHRDSQYVQTEPSQQEPSPTRTVVRVKKLVPETVRARAAGWLALRQDKRQMHPQPVVEPWVKEARERIQMLDGGPLWNPIVRPRGVPLADDSAEVLAALDALKAELGFTG